jgi:hypothetical protein
MPATTDTQPEMTFAPAEGLLAMLCLAETTTNTAAPDHAIRVYRIARNVISICRHEQRAPQPQEQNTSNTATGFHREPCSYTDVGLAPFNPNAVPGVPGTAPSFRARDAIFELRRLTGLTWEELAGLLSVARRSLHLWANGGPINSPNERRVRDLLMAIRELDRGTARENRGLLLAPLQDGGAVGELLKARRFEDALALVGRGRGRISGLVRREAVPRAEKLSVADMLGTRSDRLHTDEGVALSPRRGPRRRV